jgi:hypothetical protein
MLRRPKRSRSLTGVIFAAVTIPGFIMAESEPAVKEVNPFKARAEAVKDWPVILPGKTPYDADPTSAKEFREGYVRGYRDTLTGVIASYWPVAGQSEAMRNGLIAGQLKAMEDQPQVLMGRPPIKKTGEEQKLETNFGQIWKRVKKEKMPDARQSEEDPEWKEELYWMKARREAVKDWPVSLPEKTPYDADPAERQKFLDAYRSGYRSALVGSRASTIVSSFSLKEGRLDPAISDGTIAGRTKAWDDQPQVVFDDGPPIQKTPEEQKLEINFWQIWNRVRQEDKKPEALCR